VPGRQVRFADIDGDDKADYLTVADGGQVHAWLNRGGDGHGGWLDYGQIAAGVGAPGGNVRFANIDGDRRADYVTVDSNGAVHAWLNRGGDGHGGWLDYGQVATGVGVPGSKVRFADIDGDRKADYLTIADTGAVQAWLNRGGDGRGGWQSYGQIAAGVGVSGSLVRLSDIDGDGKADYIVVHENGAVHAWVNRGGDGHGGWLDYGQIASGVLVDASHVRL
jgi:hypothetical protein